MSAEQTNIWYPPSTPGFLDIEFNAEASLPGPWQYEDGATTPASISSADVDALASFAAGDLRVNYNSRRPSWVYLQPPGDSVSHRIAAAPDPGVELPDGCYYTRLAANYRYNSIADADGISEFMICATSGGVCDTTHSVRVWLTETDAAFVSPQSQKQEGGAALGVVQMGDHEQVGVHHEYLAILKVGSVMTAFVGSGPGNWVYLNTYTYAGGQTLDRIAVGVQNAATNAPGNMILGCDFIRYRADGQLP